MRKILRRHTVSALVAASLLAAAPAALAAGTTSGNIGVSATIGANCLLTTVAIAFGVYDPLSATPLNGTGQVQLACTVGATPAVALDNGLNVNVAQRRLVSSGNFLNYDIYEPATNAAAAACAYTNPYPTVAPGFTLTAAPTTASRNFNVCGRIPAGQSSPNGTYADTVTATITF
jgi:spore coat protein U-like protein